MITTQVTIIVNEVILELFEFIKIMLINIIDEHYETVTEAASAFATTTSIVDVGPQGNGSMQYQDFDDMKPLEFDGFRDPIVAMILIYDVEGCFNTCYYNENLKVRFLRREALVEVCDSNSFSCGSGSSDMGAFLRDVPDRVCPTCGKKVIGSGVPIAQAENGDDDQEHQDVHQEGFILP